MRTRRHPSKADLFEHAEGLLAKRVSLTSPVTRHLGGCPVCREEIESIRASLELVQTAPELEPAPNLQASTLLAAKSERQGPGRRRRPIAPGLTFARGFGLATCLVLAVSTFLHSSTATISLEEPLSVDARVVLVGEAALGKLTEVTAEEKLLSEALQSSSWAPRNRWEHAQWRALDTLESDIAEALDALKDNPALVRASAMVNVNRERRKETLKALYVNRIL